MTTPGPSWTLSTENTSWAYDVMNDVNVTQAPPGPQFECEGVTHIPGVITEDVANGLSAFSRRYYNIHGYLSLVVCVFGLMANMANIIVLTRKNMINPTNTILMWLAVADLLTMVSFLPFAIHFYIMKDPSLSPFQTRSFGWIVFLMFHASFSIVCHTVAIWLTIALAIFRYIYICMPTKGSIYCNMRRAKMVIFAVYALTIVVCIPNCISNRIDYIDNNAANSNGESVKNSTQKDATGDDIGANSQLAKLLSVVTTTSVMPGEGEGEGHTANYTEVTEVKADEDLIYFPTQWSGSLVAEVMMQVNYWIQAVMIKLLPCVMLTTLTILLIHAMHKAYRRRMMLKSQGKKADADKHGEHNRTTRMLLAVVVLFTITELPQGILTLLNNFFGCFRNLVYDNLGDLLDAMALINNSVNFLLYCVMSTQFRHTFMAIFCKICDVYRPGWLTHNVMGQGATTAQRPNNAAAHNNGRVEATRV